MEQLHRVGPLERRRRKCRNKRPRRLISKHRKRIKLGGKPGWISRGIPSLIRDARSILTRATVSFQAPGHLWRFNGFNDHTCTAVALLSRSLFRVATPSDKNRAELWESTTTTKRASYNHSRDRSLLVVLRQRPRRQRRRRRRRRRRHTEARFHLAECIKPDVVLANGTKWAARRRFLTR